MSVRNDALRELDFTKLYKNWFIVAKCLHVIDDIVLNRDVFDFNPLKRVGLKLEIHLSMPI